MAGFECGRSQNEEKIGGVAGPRAPAVQTRLGRSVGPARRLCRISVACWFGVQSPSQALGREEAIDRSAVHCHPAQSWDGPADQGGLSSERFSVAGDFRSRSKLGGASEPAANLLGRPVVVKNQPQRSRQGEDIETQAMHPVQQRCISAPDEPACQPCMPLIATRTSNYPANCTSARLNAPGLAMFIPCEAPAMV